MMTETLAPRMRIVMQALEGAKDAGDAVVIAACRRLIAADRRGWRRHHDPADYRLILDVSE